MKSHIAELLNHVVDTLKAQSLLPENFTPRIQVDRTRDKSHGDFATNLAMMAAKAAKKNPRELAQLIIDALPDDEHISQVEIAGPGFINFFINQDSLLQQLEQAYQHPRLGVGEGHQPNTVVIDYSSPNLAKEMHVGHLRSTIIGDAIARILESLGDTVIRQNHVGDWGTQFGMLLAHMETVQQKGNDTHFELSDLETFYRAAKARFDSEPDFADRARKLVVKLQHGDEYCLQLWHEFRDISLSHCQNVYDRLGVKLTRDDVRGESAYNDALPVVVEDLANRGMLTEDQGALCVFLDEFKNSEGECLPVIVRKADGGYLYASTDLAAIRYRSNQLQADRLIYVVDARQSLHFQQIFTVARRADFVPAGVVLEHLGFGTMNDEDGRPFKTRSGGTVKLVDLLDEAEKRARKVVSEKHPDLDEADLHDIARVIGISAIKYADLSKNRNSDYIFSFDQMLSFDGNTAPYLQYAYTRVLSVFRKAGINIDEPIAAPLQLQEEKETELATKLSQLNEVMLRAADRGLPNLLCNYLFELAGLFSSFYEACPILSADNEALRDSRLKLAALTGRTLRQGLEVLGIPVLERM